MPDALGVGDPASPFKLASTGGDVSLDELLAGGHRLVLAFYTEDDTPTCATEIALLRDAFDMFHELRANVLAVSADSLDAHRAFLARIGALPFPLASDGSLEAARAYGVVDPDEPARARRAMFVIEGDATVLLAIPHFQPANVSQVEAVFAALDAERPA